MKTKMNCCKMGMLLRLAAIAALCMAPPVRAGMPYATASNRLQLIADINYANTVGGAITINLATGDSFYLKTPHHSRDGAPGLPVIGRKKAVHLTIIGNGATIERIARYTRYYFVKNAFHLFEVAPGSSLTLDQVTLKGGWSAILNRGTLHVINGSILSDNTGSSGGGIYNAGGTVTVNDSTISDNGATSSGGGIYNAGGTVTVNNSTLSGGALYYGGGIYNDASGTVTLNNSTLSGSSARYGGGIYNSGGSVTVSSSTLSGNTADHYDYPWLGGDGGAIYNDGGTVAITDSSLFSNQATGVGGGIYNDPNGTVTVENFSSITDYSVDNLGVLYQDGTSTISFLGGNPAILR